MTLSLVVGVTSAYVLPVLEARIRENVDTISTATVKVPARNVPLSLTAITGLGGASIHHSEEGTIFTGYTSHYHTEVDEYGAKIGIFEIEGREVELRWRSTWRGIVVDEETPADTLDLILANSDWTGAIEGSGFPASVTKRYDNTTLIAAVFDLAKVLQGYVRFDQQTTTVTISNTPPDSGLILTNHPVGRSPQVGALASLDEVTVDYEELYNTIMPFGKIDGHDIFDLRYSDRSSPYTILNQIISSPNITTIAEVFDTTEHFPEYLALDIQVRGTDRYLLIFSIKFSDQSLDDDRLIEVNGRRATFLDQVQQTSGTGTTINVYGLPGPTPGLNTIKQFSVAGGPGTANTHLIAIALEGVDPTAPLRDQASGFVIKTTGSSTTPSASPLSTEGDLVIDVVGHQGSATSTPGAGQEEIIDETNDSDSTHISTEISDNVGTTTVMSWTLSSSSAWAQAALALRPSRNYYIQDSTSRTAYGPREKPLPLGDFKPVTPDITEAANAMYDFAVDYLIEHKDPKRFWLGKTSYIPLGPLDWDIGSSLTIEYRDEEQPVSESLVCPGRSQIFDRSGVRTWELDLSTLNQFRTGFVDVLVKLQERIEAVQANQV